MAQPVRPALAASQGSAASQRVQTVSVRLALSSEVGELSALFRWIRSEDADSALRDEKLRAKVLDEIGDVGILLLLLCARVSTTLDRAVQDKLALNARRYPVSESRGRPDRPLPGSP